MYDIQIYHKSASFLLDAERRFKLLDKKIHSKSIRLSERVLRYIEAAPGEGFNQKFENIILFAEERIPELKKEEEHYILLISQRCKQLEQISEKIQSLDIAIQAIFSLQDEVNSIQRQIDQIINDS